MPDDTIYGPTSAVTEAARPLLPPGRIEAYVPPPEPAQSFKVHGDPTELFSALAKARSEFGEVKKSTQGMIGNRTFKYTALAALTEASMPALTKHGVMPMQFLEDPPGTDGEAPARQVIRTVVAGHGA